MVTKRYKNPYFWIGLAGMIFQTMNIDPNSLTTWGALFDAICNLGQNPAMLAAVLANLMGIFLDPTTKGIKDNNAAKARG